MTNLTPEKRPDRNGKMVTRHVRSAPAASASKALPAPAVGTTKITVKEAINAVFPDHKRTVEEHPAVKKTFSQMSRRLPDTLAKIVEVSRADEDVADNMRTMIMFQEEAPDIFLEVAYERAVIVYPYAKKTIQLLYPEHVQDEDYVRESMFRMEKNVQDLVMMTNSKPELMKAVMLFSFLHGHQDEINPPVGLMWEKYEKEIRYAAHHIDEVEVIAPELLKRKEFSYGVMEQLLNVPSKSLSSGQL